MLEVPLVLVRSRSCPRGTPVEVCTGGEGTLSPGPGLGKGGPPSPGLGYGEVGYPSPGPDWGILLDKTRGTPQTAPRQDLARQDQGQDGGTPLPPSPLWTGYAVGGTPHVVTQEDFLV